ncbi:MAG: hypothetical protein ACRD5G_02325 [Candidatus Acidiferrales bacterium]
MKSNPFPRIIALLVVALGLTTGPSPLPSQNPNPKGLTREQVAAIHGRIVQSEEAGAIPARMAEGTGDIYIHAPYAIIDEIQLDTKNHLAGWMRDCDLVAIGRMGTGTSYMTARKGFLNTDWSFVVEEVLKDNTKAPVIAGRTITVIAFGGTTRIGDRTVHAIQKTYKKFRADDQYLLFLKFVPETGAYSVRWPLGFALSGQKIVAMATQPLHRPDIEAMDKEALVTTIKQALAPPYS